jgi:hypothetical protein
VQAAASTTRSTLCCDIDVIDNARGYMPVMWTASQQGTTWCAQSCLLQSSNLLLL